MSASAVDTAIDVLATFRLTKLVVDDVITEGLRDKWLQKHDPSTDKLGYVITCPWCTGFWVSALVVAARRAAPGVWDPAAKVLALSAAVGLLHHSHGGW